MTTADQEKAVQLDLLGGHSAPSAPSTRPALIPAPSAPPPLKTPPRKPHHVAAKVDSEADPFRLHRLHAAPAQGKGGCSVDVGGTTGVRWRGEGADRDLKRAMSYRMAFCWNAMEGWPLGALEAGIYRKVDMLARELADAVAFGGMDPEELQVLGRELMALYDERDELYDMTGGRPADCDECYPMIPEDRSTWEAFGEAVDRTTADEQRHMWETTGKKRGLPFEEWLAGLHRGRKR